MEQAENDTVGSITHGIHSSMKSMTNGIAILGLPGKVWYMGPKFIKAHCTALYQASFPNKKTPFFISTIN